MVIFQIYWIQYSIRINFTCSFWLSLMWLPEKCKVHIDSHCVSNAQHWSQIMQNAYKHKWPINHIKRYSTSQWTGKCKFKRMEYTSDCHNLKIWPYQVFARMWNWKSDTQICVLQEERSINGCDPFEDQFSKIS